MKIKRLLLTIGLLLSGILSAEAQPKVIAHRGYWQTEGSAQNSLTALKKAAEIGCYGSEFDVWLTADNQLIVNHDQIFKGTNIDMAESSYEEIRTIRLSNGEQIPSLEEYLDLATRLPHLRLVLEFKPLPDMNREDIAVGLIVEMVKKYGLLERTDFISFSMNACLGFRKALPKANVYFLEGCVTPSGIELMQLSGIDYSIDSYRTHPEWVEQAHAHKLGVNVWTVNSTEDMHFCIDLGMDYITTNYPEKLQAILQQSK